MRAEHADITIILEGRVYAVYTPYNAKALLAWRALPGRRFVRDRDDKGCNLVPVAQKRALWELLGRFYPGHDVHYCVGAVGQQEREFTLPGTHPSPARRAERESQDRWEQEQIEAEQAMERRVELHYEETPSNYWGAGEEQAEREAWAREEQAGAYASRFDSADGE